MSKPLMECGHSANATDSKGNPVCVICIGIVKGADKVCKRQPNLEGREAKCVYGDHGKVKSNLGLAFFEFKPGDEFDIYYCGCKGWD